LASFYFSRWMAALATPIFFKFLPGSLGVVGKKLLLSNVKKGHIGYQQPVSTITLNLLKLDQLTLLG